jgi:hypothetical protein
LREAILTPPGWRASTSASSTPTQRWQATTASSSRAVRSGPRNVCTWRTPSAGNNELLRRPRARASGAAGAGAATGLAEESRGPSPPQGPPGPPRGSQIRGGLAGGARGGHRRRRGSQGHHDQGLRPPPEPGTPQLAAHPPPCLPVGQVGAGGDQGGARERAGDVLHLPRMPHRRPQAEGTAVLLPALRAPVPPRPRRCPKHRRQGRRIHACTRTRHAPSGRASPGTA